MGRDALTKQIYWTGLFNFTRGDVGAVAGLVSRRGVKADGNAVYDVVGKVLSKGVKVCKGCSERGKVESVFAYLKGVFKGFLSE